MRLSFLLNSRCFLSLLSFAYIREPALTTLRQVHLFNSQPTLSKSYAHSKPDNHQPSRKTTPGW